MRLIRPTRTALLASAALTALPFASAHAVERNLFTWSGTVDREVIIEVHGRDILTHGSGIDQSMSPRLSVNQPLPRELGIVRAHLENGRGEVTVLDFPTAMNNYTARIRVRDPQGGADRYRVVVTFENNDTNGGIIGGARGRGDDRDRGGDNRDRNGGYDDRRGPDRGDYDHNRRDAGMLRWSGVVDDVTEISIQGNRVVTTGARGRSVRDVRFDVLGAPLPRRDLPVEIVRSGGRGSVRVVQQPTPRNGFTAIIRIEDVRGGAGGYNFDVRW